MTFSQSWAEREQLVGQSDLAKRIKAMWGKRDQILPEHAPTPPGLEFTTEDDGFGGKDRDAVAEITQRMQGNS
jgi:hypothetical protein